MADSVKIKKIDIKKQWDKYLLPELKQVIFGIRDAVKKVFSGKAFTPGIANVTYIITIVILIGFGLAVHYSASYETGKQLLFAVLGFLIMVISSHVKIDIYKDLAVPLMAISTLFLILVLLVSSDYHGTHRWLWRFQPSELGKVALIIFMAYLMDKYKSKRHEKGTFFTYLAITGIYGLMVLLESHLSGCILFLCIGYAMMWYADLSKFWFAVFTLVAVFTFMIVIWKPNILLSVPFIKPYQIERITIWKKILLDEGSLTQSERLGNARQVLQSLYGIGSGGIKGVGYGKSGQKIANLSEEANDFIFAVLGEELGLFGGIFLISIFGVLFWQGLKIAEKSRSYFGSLVVLGISTQLILQVLINIAVATSLLPNTGISLPFFSDGGSSMIITLASVGIVLAVSKDSEKNKGVNKNA